MKGTLLGKTMRIMLLIVAGLLLFETMSLLVLKHNVDAYKKYWDKRTKQTAPAESLVYVALGDSAAQGIGASQAQKGYVGLVADGVAVKYNKKVHVINLSVSGAKVQDVVDKQIPAVQKLHLPSDAIVTIEIGGNDMSSWNEQAFLSSMDELMSKLPPQTVITDMPYFGGGRKRNLEQYVLVANEIITKLAEKHNLKVAPLHKVTKEHDSLLTVSADFLHPSNQGYRNWYEAFRQSMEL